MESLLLKEEEGQMDLNIVVQEQPKPRNARKRVKKYNKYEKRRAKARLANASKNNNLNENNGALNEEERKDTAVEATPQDSDSNEEQEEVTKESVEVQESKEELPAREQNEEVSKDTAAANDASVPQQPQQPQIQSRKHHSQDSLQNEEERARYMAEFHARPMEMDRRSGASIHIRPSHYSTHLFSTRNNGLNGLQLDSRITTALTTKLQVSQPTIIQTRAIHALLQNPNANLFIQSETGSGKTLAYLLPILQSLAVDKSTNQVKQVNRSTGGTQCIVLCPTRELASQTFGIANTVCQSSFSKIIVPGCIVGGEKRKSEKARIRKGISILIATPGRLLDHLSKTESLLLALKGKLEWLVLDEADRLLDMGLGGQVEQVVQMIRANQPKSGSLQNGVTWNSVLVSATVTPRVQELGKKMLGTGEWLWARGGQEGTTTCTLGGGNQDAMKEEDLTLADSTPRQLGQLHITVSAKLRLATLIAFLVQRVKRNERTVVFMSTCNGVDYHEALLKAMDCILPGKDDDNDNATGIFGKACPIYKLHGNVPHAERNTILRKFGQGEKSSQRAALLLATDVAARGLNLPGVDWTVQYDPPCEVADYAHRAGRTARAGKAGHSLLFLLPSERPFLDILKKKGCKDMTALSLTSTLNEAAKICSHLQQEGAKRSGGGYGGSGKAGRLGEAFCAEIQHRLEDCVMEDDSRAKAAAASEAAKVAAVGGKRRRKKKETVNGRLLEMARGAYTSYLCSYPTKEKAVRHIFSARALHLGHVARSFALKEPPKALVKAQVRSEAGSTLESDGRKRKGNASLAFDNANAVDDGDIARTIIMQQKKRKASREHSSGGVEKHVDNKEARALLHARATRLQGMDAM